MAHSNVENAGQKYASARKRRESGETLTQLRAALDDRPRSEEAAAETRAEVNERIAAANKEHQSRSGLGNRW